MSNLIKREDAMGAVQDHFNANGFKGYDDGQKMMDRIKALPSAETHEIRTETHGVCSDLIRREDAIHILACEMYAEAQAEGYDTKLEDYIPEAKAWMGDAPSAEVVIREEHVKALNDLAVAWKNKFINAEKRTEEIYDETMAKVANECKECKARLQNLRPSAEAVQLTQTDTLIIADALRYLAKDEERHLSDRTRADALREQILKYGASMCHSAEAVQGWILLSHDDNGLGTDFPYERDGEWVIVTDGKTISVERIKKDAYDHFFPNGRWFELEDVIAWMPLPTPYKGGEDE